MNIIETVIPAAGFGTRFLPITKAVPKEMLPLLNKPAIQYIVQEAVDSLIKHCIIITTPHKEAIENYFKTSPVLESFLEEKNKLNLIKDLNELIRSTQFTYVNQSKALGLGHAISLARAHVTQEYFGVQLPDDIIINLNPGLAQLIAIAQQENASVIAVQEVAPEFISSYGVIAIEKQISSDVYQISTVVEKPSAHKAPSNLAIIGRYILSQKIFKALDEVSPSSNGEIQLTDGIARLIQQGNKVYAYTIQGNRYDTGTPGGWLQANIALSVYS